MFARRKDCGVPAARQANSMRFLAGPVVGHRASINARTRTGRVNDPDLSFFDRGRSVFEFWLGGGVLDNPRFLEKSVLKLFP